MAASDRATKAEEDAVFSTLPELSNLAPDQDVGSFAAANETIFKDEVCNAQSAAGSSPRLAQSDQELTHCIGVASIPEIPAEFETTLTLRASDVSLPPMVDSVTNNLLKVSINQSLGSTGEHLLHSTTVNGERGHIEHHEMSMVIPANDNYGGDVSLKKADFEPKSLSSNGHAATVNANAFSLLMDNRMVGVNSSKDGTPHSELNSDNDDDGGDDDDIDDDEEEEADDSGIDIDDDEEVDDSKSEVGQDSDSSSSTSSLSFLSSSDEDDEEVNNLHRLLNGDQKDLVMEVESECEEGELKESPSQRKKGSLRQKARNESSEDEEGLKETNWSSNKTKGLPYVPKVSVTLQQYHNMEPVGLVSSVVGVTIIVEGMEGKRPLNEGSILWLTDQRLPLGIVDELFGPVKKPFYAVRFNDASEMPEGVKEGAEVSYVLEFADFALNNLDLYSKGYDESGDEDNSDSEVNFSDDEKEAEYKRSKSRMKRGNSETSTVEVDNRRHQAIRAEGKRLNRDKKNWRSRGENTRNFDSNHEFSGRPPRHQNVRFKHCRSEREPNRVDPMQMSNERNKQWRGNRSPVRQAQSQQSLSVDLSKSSTPASSTSDGSVPTQSQGQPSKMNQLQSTSSPIAKEPILINQICSTSQPIQTNQLQHSTSQQTPRIFTQPTSQQVQLLHMNQPQNLMQSTSQQVQMNQPHGSMQSTLQQVLPWQANQQQMPPLQLPGIQHSQMPVYGHAVVAGQVPQAVIGGYGASLANNPPLQPGTDTVQGVPPTYQSPIYQQQAPSLNQFSSSVPHHFSGQASQGPLNTGMSIGNQIQAVNANGYPVGVQSAALAAPVLGIPAGSANTPFNYPTQMVSNQNFLGFTPAFAIQSQPSTYGLPEQARAMQPMAATSWQQQQHSRQDSVGPRPQQPFHQRPHQMRGPYQGRRF